MNQLVTTAPRGLALPQLATEAMALATQLSMSRTIPQAFQKSPADCFNVLAICIRFGFDFYSTIWECSIIKGRLFFSGKMVHAMLNSSGFLAERLDFEYGGEGKERTVTVTGRIGNETKLRTVVVPIETVRTENENWRKQPDQQLSYAGARIWGRRHLPEVLLGMLFEGETIDVTPTVVATTPELPTPEPQGKPYTVEGRDTYPPAKATPEYVGQPANTGEPSPPVEPFSMEPPADEGLWRDWCMRFVAYVKESRDPAEVERWRDVNDTTMQTLREQNPRLYKNVENIIDQQKAKVAEQTQ